MEAKSKTWIMRIIHTGVDPHQAGAPVEYLRMSSDFFAAAAAAKKPRLML
jgi:hypothetical protein